MVGWIEFILFVMCWVGFIAYATRKEKSATVAIGGGFVLACCVLVVIALAYKLAIFETDKAVPTSVASIAGVNDIESVRPDDAALKANIEALPKEKTQSQSLPKCDSKFVAQKIEARINDRSDQSGHRFVGLVDISQRTYNSAEGIRVCWGTVVTSRYERPARFDIKWNDAEWTEPSVQLQWLSAGY